MIAKTITTALITILIAGTAQAQFCPQCYYQQPVYVAPMDHIVIQGVYAPYKSRFDSTIQYGSVWRKVPIINGIAPQVQVFTMNNGGKKTVYDYSNGLSYAKCNVYGQKPKTTTNSLPPREELDDFGPRQTQENTRPDPPSNYGPEKIREPVREPELPLPPRQDLGVQPFDPVAPKGMSFPNQVPTSENVVRPTYKE